MGHTEKRANEAVAGEDDPKRHLDNKQGLANGDSIDTILAKERVNDSDFKEVLKNATPAQRLCFIQRQLGHYLSNENLSHDQFYHDKFKECSQSTGEKDVIGVDYILSAKRMVDIGATVKDLDDALKEYPLEGVSLRDVNGNRYFKLENGLPQFVGKRFYEKKKKFGDTPETYHAAGPLLVVANIPSDIKEWGKVKDALQSSNVPRIRFISPISDEGRCFVWVSKTPNPHEILNNVNVLMGENALEINLVQDESQYKEFISAMLPGIVSARYKDLQRIQSSTMASPIDLDGIVIRNFGLIKCLLNDFLNGKQGGTRVPVDSKAGRVLRYILDYHPHASEKKGGKNKFIVGFEVVEGDNKNSKGKRFCIVYKDNNSENESKEDVSLTKCLEGLRQVAYKLPKVEGRDFITSLIE